MGDRGTGPLVPATETVDHVPVTPPSTVAPPHGAGDATDDRCVRYDADAGALLMAGRRRPLGADASNERVLREYVDLVGECRGRPLGALAQVRDEDVDALALALDLDAEHLIAEIEAVLAQTPAEARALADRLRARRLQIAGAVVAAGVVVGGLVVARSPGGDTAPAAPPSAVVTASTVAPGSTPGPSSTVDPGTGESVPGVDLIPAVTVINEELEPPATVVVDDVTLLEEPPTTEVAPPPDGP